MRSSILAARVAQVAAVRLRGCWCGWLPCGLLLLWLLRAYTAATKASPWQGSWGGQSQRSLRPCSFPAVLGAAVVPATSLCTCVRIRRVSHVGLA